MQGIGKIKLLCCLIIFVAMDIAFAGTPENPTSQPAISITPPIAPLPQALASFGAAVADDWLYVLCGHIGEEHQHSNKNLSHDFIRLNLIDRVSWEILPNDVGLQSVALVSHHGMLYRIGGMHATNAPGEKEDLQSVTDYSRFDPDTRQWKMLTPLPQARSSHDAIVYRDKLYVAGGWTLRGASADATWLDHAYEMDLNSESNTWKELPKQPFHRRAVAVAAVRNKLFVLGGIDDQRQPSTRVDVLDLNTQTWSIGPELPNNGFGISAVAVGDELYVSGIDGDLNRLNTDGTQWEHVTSLNFPRFFHRLVAADDRELIAVGGAAKSGHIRQIESIATQKTDEKLKASTWALPFPGQAKNRQGVFFHNSTLYLFGGNNSLEQHDFEPDNFLKEALKVSLGPLSIERMAEFPVARQSMVTAVIGGAKTIGYAIGGFGHDGEVARSYSDVFRYDFKKNNWQSLGEKMPAPRTQFGLATRGTELWIFGGLDYDPRREKDQRFQHLVDVLKWDTLGENESFKTTEFKLPQPRRAAGSTVLGDRFYLVGGMRENFKLVESCDVFNFATQSWETIPQPKYSRISPELTVLNDQLYLVGGSSPDETGEIVPNPSIERYDPEAKQWSLLTEHLPITTKHLRLFSAGQNLLFASTHDEAQKTIRLMMLRPEQTRGTSVESAENPKNQKAEIGQQSRK